MLYYKKTEIVRQEVKALDKQIETVVREFTKQAESFNEYQKIFSKEEYTRFAIDHMQLNGNEKVLEVAAGTCAFGRAVAPFASHITELDVTEAMLQVGKAEAEKAGITNVSFVKGAAEQLPFGDQSFDCVMSRLAFHHFARPEAAFSQMKRVLKNGGKLVIIDMEAREEGLRTTADTYERLRDPSHVRCLSRREIAGLVEKFQMSLDFCQTIRITVTQEPWMDVTRTEEPIRKTIRAAMQEELANGKKTGFAPFVQERNIYFYHKWMLVIAIK